MNSSNFALYGRDDTRVAEIFLQDTKEGVTYFGIALRSSSDRDDDMICDTTALTRMLTADNPPKSQDYFRLPRALGRLHDLCKEDFIKLMTFYDTVINFKVYAPRFPMRGISVLDYNFAVELFNSDLEV